jgi:hypothetical protein
MLFVRKYKKNLVENSWIHEETLKNNYVVGCS